MHIVITRPKEDSFFLIERLKKLGHIVTNIPVLKIEGLNTEKIKIKAKLLSASPKKLTPIKKAIAVATPPRGGIFLSTSLASSFFEDFLNFIDFAVYKIIQLNTPDKTKVKIAVK